MTSGDPSSWNDFFQQDLVPSILSLVVETWETMPKPNETNLEDAISIKLYSALVKGKQRNKHAFLIRYQDVEVDFDLSKETGRKDIVFYPSHLEEIYFCLEAKRLHARISGVLRSLADEYVKEGMQRFVDRKYSRAVRHGGMLAYVLDGRCVEALEGVNENVKKHWQSLRMIHNCGLSSSTLRSGDPLTKETWHHRLDEQLPFRLHHLFVPGTPTKEDRTRRVAGRS